MDIRRLVGDALVFTLEEIDVAKQLVDDALIGEDYQFYIAEQHGKIVGYTCYGRICLSDHSYDLYWLVVDKRMGRQGLAQRLMDISIKDMKTKGMQQLHAETSSKEAYAPARHFYVKYGFKEVASFKDFYRFGDDKVVFVYYS
jgi:ribosomal protein S18 acetylase RimI-like enzyme